MTQVRYSEDNHVIKALAPNTPKKSFAHRIHQGGSHCRSHDANGADLGDPVEDRTELVVAVADDEPRSDSERSCVSQLS
jgi:hypothetical protein